MTIVDTNMYKTLESLESLVVPSDVPQSSRTVEDQSNGLQMFEICQGQTVLKKQKEKKSFAAGTNKPRRLDSWLQGLFFLGQSLITWLVGNP